LRLTSAAHRDAQAETKFRSDLRRFGLTADMYEALLVAQGGGCAMCGKPCSTGRRLAVDHDHATGCVRALLCYVCNQKLGVYESVREQAVAYLARYGQGNPLIPEGLGSGPLPRERRRRHPANAKLTLAQMQELRARYARGGVTQRQLALEYGTSQINVSRIVRGETWHNIT
jgi:hypothetical protein